jgi:hypothetical protein
MSPLWSVIMLNIIFVESHKLALYAECRYSKCRYAECLYNLD